jgi:hypothetical protein
MAEGGADLAALGRRLREAGTEGRGLYRALMDAIGKAAEPLAGEISDTAHLDPYMPDRYAAILGRDMRVTVRKSLADGKVTIRADGKGGGRKRKIRLIERGFINHPVFAQGPRKTWNWKNGQTKGMRPGFFDDAVRKHAPDIRDKAADAVAQTRRKIAGG